VGCGRLGILRAQWARMRRRSGATFGIRKKKTWDKRSLHSEKSPGRKSGEIYKTKRRLVTWEHGVRKAARVFSRLQDCPSQSLYRICNCEIRV